MFRSTFCGRRDPAGSSAQIQYVHAYSSGSGCAGGVFGEYISCVLGLYSGVHFRSLFAQFPFIIDYLFSRPHSRPHRYLFSLLTRAIHPICCENSGAAEAPHLHCQHNHLYPLFGQRSSQHKHIISAFSPLPLAKILSVYQ